MITVASKSCLFERATDCVITALEHGIVPWRKSWNCAGPPRNAITGTPYTGINLWLLLSLPYPSTRYVTAAQVADAGGRVQPWARQQLLITGQPDAPMQEAVYNVKHVSGLPNVVPSEPLLDLHPPVNACAACIVTMVNKPEIRSEGSTVSYSVSEDVIYVTKATTFPSFEEYYAALFHQLIHSSGHPSRLNRPSIHEMAEYGHDACSYEELVAELGAGYLCSMLQIAQRLPECSGDYIGRWLEKLRSHKEMLVYASHDAQRAVEYLLQENPVAALVQCL